MNSTDCSSDHLCFNSTAPDDYYSLISDLIKVVAVVVHLIACPLVILLNALVIVAIKTKRRLQTRSNILLASLAGTDLVMGLTSQPAFIATEIFRLAGGSLSVLGTIHSITRNAIVVVCLASIFHLVLISVDRLVAMKFSLRYDTIVTKFRITVAGACSWIIGVTYVVIRTVSPEIVASLRLTHLLVAISLLVIIYCHGSVYLVCRRHLIQI